MLLGTEFQCSAKCNMSRVTLHKWFYMNLNHILTHIPDSESAWIVIQALFFVFNVMYYVDYILSLFKSL